MCVGNEDRAKQCLSVCVSCPSLISAFPLSLFPLQTGFNYCPCSDLKLLWPLRTAPSPVLIAAQTSPPLQTSAILLCHVPLSFILPIESICLFSNTIHLILSLFFHPLVSRLPTHLNCHLFTSVLGWSLFCYLLLNFQCCAMIMWRLSQE